MSYKEIIIKNQMQKKLIDYQEHENTKDEINETDSEKSLILEGKSKIFLI